MAYPSDLVRTKDWGTETLTDGDLEGQLDILVNWVMAAMNASSGHDHSGDDNKGGPLTLTGMTKTISQAGHGLSVGDWVKFTSGSFSKAQADSAANAEVVGIVSAVNNSNEFILKMGGHVTGLTGLTANTVYFLDESTAGALTATEPSAVGEISKPLLIADTTTSGYILQMRGMDVTDQAANKVLQVVNHQTGAYSSGTTAMNFDDSIPQITEGDEYMTLAITPTSASNKLKIEVTVCASISTGDTYLVALFQDSTANALAAVRGFTSANDMVPTTFTHYMTAGTADETTFRVRAGRDSGTFYLNGISGARILGGVCSSSITITEIQA